MNFKIDADLDRKLRKIKSTDKSLTEKIKKQLKLFQENHLHPSLRTHKLIGEENIWSISIDKSIRMLFIFSSKGVVFFDIGTHDQVYRK